MSTPLPIPQTWCTQVWCIAHYNNKDYNTHVDSEHEQEIRQYYCYDRQY